MGDVESFVEDVIDSTPIKQSTDFVIDLFGGGGGDDTNVNVNYPAPTAEETTLMQKQSQWLDILINQLGAESELEKTQRQYFDQLQENQVLSPEEESAFNQEYELQKQALMEQFNIEAGQAGAKRYAQQVASGIADTTTGVNIERDTKLKESQALLSSLSELGLSRETAKSDFELAKQEMSLQGYKLTSQLMQDQLNQALSVSSNIQNYYSANRSMQAQTALQNAINKQVSEQSRYQNRLGLASIGTSLALAAA